ncbi:MAG TPA: sensor histidine kinase [Steroidobacteraceae bacterium]|nr:sensor histidine kinase [Steroidobacteraceae bacterium]
MKPLLLPDFCAPRAVLLVLVIITLTALLLTLAAPGPGPGFWGELARRQLFLIWVGLTGAALLCALRPYIAARGALTGALLVLAVVLLVVAAVSESAWWILHSALFNPSALLGRPPVTHSLFLARNLLIGAMVGALALRYAYVTQQWRLNVEAQARARSDALQARIRPHFLYNSMNTIAALTRSDPARAEEAVLDLTELFRANLDERRNLITLQEELENARTYLRIEQLRMGERLRVHWDVAALPMQAQIPALTLQPLLENAILHGVSKLPGGGEVHVDGNAADGALVLKVRNRMPLEGGGTHAGHGIALENIRERLSLLHGGRSSVTAGREGDEFVVQLRFPVVEAPRTNAG